MRYRLIEIGVPLLAVLAGAVIFGLWLQADRQSVIARPRPTIEKRHDSGVRPEDAAPTPTPADTPRAAATTETPPAKQPASAPTTIAGAWPSFRGAYRDGVSYDRTPLANAWTGSEPKACWSVKLGEGYAGPVVLNSRVYLLDYDEAAKRDLLRCFTLSDGRELWQRGYPAVVGKQHGITRTTPAVTANYVVAISPRCRVYCADAATGAPRWTHDLVKEYGATVPEWNAGQCPLIENNRAIIAPGGSALLVAFDCATGKEVWRTPNPDGWKMTHSSILPMTWKGRRMYVYCGSGGVVGVNAADGAVLWKTTDWVVHTANIPTPVSLGDGRIFLSGGYGAGSMMIRLTDTGGAIGVEQVFKLKEGVFGAYQQTPIYYNKYIYGVIPNGQLACLDPEGSIVWKSGTQNRYAWDPYLIADGKIFLLNDKGELSVAAASPRGFSLLAKKKVLTGPEPWAPIALAGRRLLVRDLTTMHCLDVGRTR